MKEISAGASIQENMVYAYTCATIFFGGIKTKYNWCFVIRYNLHGHNMKGKTCENNVHK